MAGPVESDKSADTVRVGVAKVTVVESIYDINARVNESYSSWLLWRESTELGADERPVE
jgi:hypothetical protein